MGGWGSSGSRHPSSYSTLRAFLMGEYLDSPLKHFLGENPIDYVGL